MHYDYDYDNDKKQDTKSVPYTTFLIWPLFRGSGRNPYKNFVGF
jgi:hypothetical protein